MTNPTIDELRRQIEQLRRTVDILALKVEEHITADKVHAELVTSLERRLRIIVNRINQIIHYLNERRS
jgi:hypothetical protein